MGSIWRGGDDPGAQRPLDDPCSKDSGPPRPGGGGSRGPMEVAERAAGVLQPAWGNHWPCLELGAGTGKRKHWGSSHPEGWQSRAGNPSWCPGRQGVGSSSPIHSLSSSHHLANRRTSGFWKIARLGLGGAGEQRRPPRRSQTVCLEVEPDLQWCRGDAGGQDQAEREAHNLSSNSQEGRGLPSSSLWPQRCPARARKWEC